MSQITVHDKTFRTFLSEEAIQQKIAELATQINRDYEGKRVLLRKKSE